MDLESMLLGNWFEELATATGATVATDPGVTLPTVAGIAGIAVATPPDRKVEHDDAQHNELEAPHELDDAGRARLAPDGRRHITRVNPAFGKPATAIPATAATGQNQQAGTVATIETVAVANPSDGRTAKPAGKDDAGDAATTRHDAQPDATGPEPSEPTQRQPVGQMTTEVETAILRWLDHAQETDPATIAEVMDGCRSDPNTRAYFYRLGIGLLYPSDADDRQRCNQCRNLATDGRCLAAWRGEILAHRDFAPVPDFPLRCEGFEPHEDNPDQRRGRERWGRYLREAPSGNTH